MTEKWIRHRRLRPYVFLVFSTLAVLIGGSITLLWQVHDSQSSNAAGGIVGPPTLPAETVDKIFARVGSPMVGTGKVVEQAARQANIDDAFALAVWWVETNDGAAGVGRADRNPGSVRGGLGYPVAYDGYTIYPSYATAVLDWFNLLRNRYVNRGMTSVYTICYPYVGTASALSWANKVVNFMARYHSEAPPPTAIATPTQPAKVDSVPVYEHRVRDQQQETRPATVLQRIRQQDQQAQASPVVAGTTALLASINEERNLVVGLAILAALLLAGWTIMLRRKSALPAFVEHTPTTEALSELATPLPPLFANEFSPVLESDTAQLLEWEEGPISQPLPAAVFAPAEEESGSTRTTDPSLRRVVLVRSDTGEYETYVVEEQVEGAEVLVGARVENFEHHQRSLSLSGLSPSSSGTQRSGGLLQRYREGQW